MTFNGSGGLTVVGGILSNAGAVGITSTGTVSVPGQISGQAGVTFDGSGGLTVAGGILSNAGAVAITSQGAMSVPGQISGQSAFDTARRMRCPFGKIQDVKCISMSSG